MSNPNTPHAWSDTMDGRARLLFGGRLNLVRAARCCMEPGRWLGVLAGIGVVLLCGCASAPKSAPPPVSSNVELPSTPPAEPLTTAPAPPAVPPAAPSPAPPPPKDLFKEAAARPGAPWEGEGWQTMFDGQSLDGWQVTEFAGHGEVECRSGLIALKMGDPFTGVNWTNPFPKMNYEVALDAARIMGSDFFCGLTVPVNDSFCSLIVGGWGGGLVGISSLNGLDASENETTKFIQFETGRWYRLRLRVTEKWIQAWIDEDKLIDVDISDKRVSLRPGEIERSKPFGVASWQTSSAFRDIRWRTVSEPAGRKRN